MQTQERREFVEAMIEATELIRRTQAALQRAKSKCNGQLYEHLDVASKRVYEVKVISDWLRLAALGGIQPSVVDPEARDSVDRRAAIDRRVEGMRREVLAATRLHAVKDPEELSSA